MDTLCHRKLTTKEREIADRRFVMWSAINFWPQNILQDVGFKLFIGTFEPDYISRAMSAEVFDGHLPRLYADLRKRVLAEIGEHRKSCLALGYTGPFLSGQVDLTTVAGEEYITFRILHSSRRG